MNETPIILNQNLIRKFQRQGKDFANLVGLYVFYITHAQLQKTNQPLATDSFTANGLNWGLDKVKRIKRILKDLKVIEMVQHKKYSYVHLFFIYSKKKIDEVLFKLEEGTPTEKAIIAPKKEAKKVEKSIFEQELVANNLLPLNIKKIVSVVLNVKDMEKYKFDSKLFAKWIVHCEHNNIAYNSNNIKYWVKKLDKRTSLEQEEAVYKAIDSGWKDIYIDDVKKSKFHEYLGRSLKSDGKECLVLQDVSKKGDKFVYQFQNIRVITKEPIDKIFERCEYTYDNSINAKIKNVILGAIKKF